MGMEDDILKDFLAESKENLELLDQQFVELEQEPDNEDLIKSIFRTIHTIKGTSGFFGFTTLEGIAHFAEDILSKLRDGVVQVNEEITTVLLQSVDYITAILAELENTGQEPVNTEYLDFIVDLRNFAEKITKGASSATGPETSAPVSDQASSEEDSQVEPEESASEPAGDSREEPASSEEKSPKEEIKAEQDRDAEKAEKKAKQEKPAPRARKTKAKAPAAHLAETHVRIDVHLLDQLMTLAGELVLSRNRMTQLASKLNDPDFATANQRMSLVVTELQEQIMKTRMQPIGNVFNKFPRIVRDLAKSASKKVQLRIVGAETELDRSIIESIKDPLTHMVRNSIDHGIEASDIRLQKEKPAVGNLTMKAYHEGGQVIIEITDDGAGIDPEKLRAKAVEKGLISEDQARSLSNREALMLIFQPGFSTAEKVTSVSGRGVGMDVVNAAVKEVRGRIEIDSTPGKGTRVAICIPLTLAFLDSMVVEHKDIRYAIPTENVLEILRPEKDWIVKTSADKSEIVRVREELIPILRLEEFYHLKNSERPKEQELLIIVRSERRPVAIPVDDVLGQQQVTIKPLQGHAKSIRAGAGWALLGSGETALVLDCVRLDQGRRA